jgi:hypothetical protein
MTTERDLDQFVRAHVTLCLSSLVATLAMGAHAVTSNTDMGRNLGDLVEQAGELCVPVDDYEEAAIQDGWKHVETRAGICMVFHHSDGRISDNTNWESLCGEWSIDPYQWEVYEHWVISDRLAELLEAEGERVDRDFAGLTVWGRTTTGQAISMDGVIARCYERAQAELGELLK